MTFFDFISLICILLVTFAGGYVPLFGKKTDGTKSYPGAEAFTAGIFLALSLVIMLPAATCLLDAAWHTEFPLASVISVLFFFLLLSIEHAVEHLRFRLNDPSELVTPAIPIIMTSMIAIPRFHGRAWSQFRSLQGVIFLRSLHIKVPAVRAGSGDDQKQLTPHRRLLLFSCFALSTPLGIVLGGSVHGVLGGPLMQVVKGLVLSMASGTFLYLGTLHELKRAPLITHCNCRRNFLLLLFGFLLTVVVRILLGAAHQG